MKIGIYLGSFKPMHIGHEQTLIQAAQQNEILLFFPGFGAKGVKKGKRKNPATGNKEDFYRPLDDQAMLTDDLGEQQFQLLRSAIEEIKLTNPSSPLSHVKIFLPGEVIEGYEVMPGPIASALQIVGVIADHYVDNEGDMTNVYIPFLNINVNNPEVRLYSDVTDVKRVTPTMLERFKINPEGIKGIYMKNFIPVGIVRGPVDADYDYERANFETEEISGTELRRKIRNLENLEGDDLESSIQDISALMPNILSQEVKREFLSTIRRLDRERREQGGIFKSALGKLDEITRSEAGTPGYTSYLEALMDELKHIKSGYESRKKTGSRYRKEASKIQDAYSELRRLRNKNNKFINAQKVNEVINQNKFVANVYVDEKKEFNSDSIRSFFRKLK
tara:strand:- start:1304 stop:2476 length:1173 start_codon:yes stop_codon:yes gene_type:complete